MARGFIFYLILGFYMQRVLMEMCKIEVLEASVGLF